MSFLVLSQVLLVQMVPDNQQDRRDGHFHQDRKDGLNLQGKRVHQVKPAVVSLQAWKQTPASLNYSTNYQESNYNTIYPGLPEAIV